MLEYMRFKSAKELVHSDLPARIRIPLFMLVLSTTSSIHSLSVTSKSGTNPHDPKYWKSPTTCQLCKLQGIFRLQTCSIHRVEQVCHQDWVFNSLRCAVVVLCSQEDWCHFFFPARFSRKVSQFFYNRETEWFRSFVGLGLCSMSLEGDAIEYRQPFVGGFARFAYSFRVSGRSKHNPQTSISSVVFSRHRSFWRVRALNNPEPQWISLLSSLDGWWSNRHGVSCYIRVCNPERPAWDPFSLDVVEVARRSWQRFSGKLNHTFMFLLL